jgi:hypothetical protein
MKKIQIISTILLLILLNSCTEVINVDLNTESPRLVIEASINWQKGTAGNTQKIKLTTTTNYYTNLIPTVSNATVTIRNSANTSFNFIENAGTGIYECTNFVPVLNETYTLTVTSNGNVYTATETLMPIAPIVTATQENNGGISGNKPVVRFVYTDPSNIENFYLYKFKYSNKIKPDIYVDKDEFFNGNPFFSVSFNDDLKPEDKIDVIHYGISQRYFEYMSVLLSVSGNAGGGPFQSPPVSVRGNIVNTTNEQNYPFGYFNLSEIDTKSYTIQ